MEFIDIPPFNLTSEYPDSSLSSEVQFLPNGEQLVKVLHSSAEHLRKLTDSDGYIFYQVDFTREELYICPSKVTTKTCLTARYTWRLDQNDTIAIYAFKNMTPILVDADYSIDLNFPYLQALPNLSPRFILSIPLVSFQKRCFGVVEYYRNGGRQYNEVDVKVCQFLLQNAAEAFKQNENAIFFKRYNKAEDLVQYLMEQHCFVDGYEGSYKFLSEIVKMTRRHTRAMSSALFFEKNNILRRIVNTDGSTCFALEHEVQNETGQILRSIASVDFTVNVMNHQIHGIINVCNKIDDAEFSLLDEQIMEAFAKMCKVWSVIEYSHGYLKKQKTLNENIMNLIHLQLVNAGDFDKKIRASISLDRTIVYSWSYSLDSSIEMKKVFSDVVEMIKHVKGTLPLKDDALRDFVVMVEQCHLNPDDFDFRCTTLRVHGLFMLLESCKSIASEQEAFAMVIGSLCHNIAVYNTPTAVSATFERYNLYATDLIGFEIVQFLLEETKLLNQWTDEMQKSTLTMIKEFMISMNLDCLKLNVKKFRKVMPYKNIKLEMTKDPELRSLIRSIMPGVGSVLGYFRSEFFQEWFPNFTLFEYLEQNQLNCIDIISLISPL